MIAVIETGGKQYTVSEGDLVRVEKLEVAENQEVTLDKVLFTDAGGKVQVGKPYVSGFSVKATVVEHGRAETVLTFRKRRRHDSKKKVGNRQHYTLLKISKLG